MLPSTHFRAVSANFIRTLLFLAGIACAACSAHAQAQDFPNKTITVIIPFTPGGPDRVARLVADGLHTALKQPVVIDYKPGAAGLIGTAQMMRSKPDGYTLMFTSNSGAVIAPLLRDPPSFDPLKDLVPVSLTTINPIVLTIPPNHPANNMAEFIRWAKANPANATYASLGVGTLGHLLGEMFGKAAGIPMTHVPFKGVGDAQTAVIQGTVQLFFDAPTSAVQLLRTGKVKALGVIADRRLTPFPEIPTLKELGLSGVNSSSWIGFFAPKGTPDAIVQKLSIEMDRVLRSEKVQEQIMQGGLAEVGGGSPGRFAEIVEADVPVFRRLIKELNLKVE